MESEKIPQHIAIIMDGNGRWAKARNLPRVAGHRKGMEQIKEVIRASRDRGVKYLTIFAFSSENWNRPKKEVSMLMRALDNFLTKELKELNKNDIRLRMIGRKSPIPEYLQKKIESAENSTKKNKGLHLVVALNYGARQEIIDAAGNFARSVLKGERRPEDLSVETFADFLYTAAMPDPDLLIRTSGEIRISNFLLWQLSYSELYFVDKYWPDFGKEDLNRAISEYQKRERRFGKIR